MGQVIHLNRLSAASPTAAVTALDKAETVFLDALRTWVAAYRPGEDPLSRLCEAMDRAGAHGAAFSVLRRPVDGGDRTLGSPAHCNPLSSLPPPFG